MAATQAASSVAGGRPINTYAERKAARRARRARALAGYVRAGLDDATPATEIARAAGMGPRTLRHYLSRHGYDDLALALEIRGRWRW